MSWLERLEYPLLRRIVCEWESPLVDGLAAFLNDEVFGVPFFLLLFLLGMTTARGRARAPRAVVTTLLAMGLAHGVLAVLWRTMPRDRPGEHFTEEQTLRGPIQRASCGERPEMWVERAHPPKSPSFPSSHTVTAGAAAGGLTTLSPLLGAVGWVYAVLVGVARLYWGKHWPSDVAGALLLCVAATWVAWRLSPRALAALGRLRRRGGRAPGEPA